MLKAKEVVSSAHPLLQKKTKRTVSASNLSANTEKPTVPLRAKVSTVTAHEAPVSVAKETMPAVVIRPRAQSVAEHPTQLIQTKPATQPVKVVTATTSVAERTPQRQADLQRLLLGTDVDARMTKAGIQVANLEQKPGLQALLANTARTDNASANVASFLKEMSSTPAEKLPPSPLNFLYEHRTTLTGRQGLKDFLVTNLEKAEDEGALGGFVDGLQRSEALNLPADRLAQLYTQRAIVLNRPEIGDFLVNAHVAKEDVASLDNFVSEIKGGPAENLKAPQLDFLYKQRAVLQDKPGLKEFVVEALGGGETQTDLEGLLAESKDPRVAAFEKDQAAYFYKNRSALQDQAGLKELVIDKVSSTSEWKQGLDQFLPAIAPLKTDHLSNGQLEYLYGLRSDLEKTVTDRPTQGQSTSVKALAVDRMSDQKISSGQAMAEIEDLKAFGYKGKLLDFAQTKAASRGAEQLKLALAAVDTDEKEAVDAAKLVLEENGPKKPEGKEPITSGLSGKARRTAETAKKKWTDDLATYNDFKTKQLPVLMKTEAQKLKPTYDLKRNELKRDKDGTFVSPELEKYRTFVRDEAFHDDAEWALKTADGNIEQVRILFAACKDDSEMKTFGAWAAKNSYTGQKLLSVLTVAKDLQIGADKAQAVAPFLANCSDEPTKQWLEQRAPNRTIQDLTFVVGLLKEHSNKTLGFATAAIDAAPGDDVLAKYNKFLAKPELGPEILRIVQDGSIKVVAVAKVVNAYGNRGDLEPFLKAVNPLPTGYTSLSEICLKIKDDPQAQQGIAIDDVTYAVTQGTAVHNEGKPYIEHLLTRIGEGLKRADIKSNDMGFKEWLLVSGKPWGPVDVQNQGFGPTAMTGIFKLTIENTDIEVHNHFYKKGGAQYSLHLKDGKSTFAKGTELEPKKDKSVYSTISQGCLDAYRTWVGNKGWDLFTI